jgi:hypothetical protein
MDVTWINACPLLGGLSEHVRFVPVRYAVDAQAARVRATLAASQA